MNRLTKYIKNRFFLGLICGLLVMSQSPYITACPFCSAPSLTLTEQLSQSDVAVLAQWSEAEKGTLEKAGKTVFEIKEIIRQSDKGKLKVGDQITINRHRPGKKGNLFYCSAPKEPASTGATRLKSPKRASITFPRHLLRKRKHQNVCGTF